MKIKISLTFAILFCLFFIGKNAKAQQACSDPNSSWIESRGTCMCNKGYYNDNSSGLSCVANGTKCRANSGNCQYTECSGAEITGSVNDCETDSMGLKYFCCGSGSGSTPAPTPDSGSGASTSPSSSSGSGDSGVGSQTTAPAANSATPNMDCDANGICFPTNTNLPDPSGGILQIITNLLYWFLGIFGILAIIAFVISGIQYILSAGDEKMIDTAKRSMKWSIVGVAIALAGLVIVYAIDALLRGTNVNF
jgi:hypothetical protein